MKKQMILYAIILSCAGLLCGCGVGKNSEPPSKSAVDRAVREEVCGENVVLDYIEKTDEVPRKDIYHYKSEDRDLTFQVESYVKTSDIGIGASPLYVYSKDVSVHYWDAVKEYYEPELDEILCDASKKGNGYTYKFFDYNELTYIIDRVKEAEECYAEETKYHDDRQWYDNHMVASISIVWESMTLDENGDKQTQHLFPWGYPVSAVSNTDDTYTIIASCYAGKIVSGIVEEDNTIPDDVLALGHKDKLTTVIVNGTEMVDEMSYMFNLTPSVAFNGVFYAEYNYHQQCYMMRIDPGCGTKRGRSHPLQALVKAAGGTGGDNCSNDGKEEWTINGNHYVIKADRDKGVNFIKGASLTKNGKPVEFTYTCRGEYTRSGDMILVSVEDLAQMLELSVTIDEESGTIIFE